MGGSCCRRLSRCRCLTPRRGSVSSRRSPNPTCGFPALGSPVGSCASHTRILPIRPAVARKTDRECMLGDGTTPAYRTVSFRTCHQACLRLDGTGPFDGCGPSSGSGPSLVHAMPSGIPGQIRGDRHCHSQDPAPFQHPSSPEAPSLGRRYPASSVLRASPPPRPARPVPRGIPVGACHTTDGASRVASIPLFHACCRHYPGGTRRCSRRSLPARVAAFPELQAGRLPLGLPGPRSSWDRGLPARKRYS